MWLRGVKMQSDKTESVDLCSHYQTAGWAQAWAFETLGKWWDLYGRD